MKALSTVSALSICLAAGPALADLTADEAWALYRGYITASAMDVTIDGVTSSDGQVTVSDLTLGMDQDDVTVTGVIPSLVFTEQGDGSVRFEQQGGFDLTATVTEEGETITIASASQDDLAGVMAEGAEGAILFTYEDQAADATLTVAVDGDTVLDGDLSMGGISGTYVFGGGDRFDLEMDFLFDTLTGDFALVDPETNGTGEIALALSGLSFSGESNLGGVDPETFAAGFPEDGFLRASYGVQELKMDIAIDDPVDGSGNLSITSAANELGFEVSDTVIRYSTAAGATDLSISGFEMPFPMVGASYGSGGLNILFPIAASAEGQQANFGLFLRDLVVDDTIWNLFDPAAQLPRDPATLEVDLEAQLTVLQDLMTVEGDDVPLEIESLTINTLSLDAIGVSVSALGAALFDFDRPSPFGPGPAVEGAVDILATGIEGAMDTLTRMGLLPEEQVMGARMMLGLFARPGDEPDSLTSRLEVTFDGQVSANGQRLR